MEDGPWLLQKLHKWPQCWPGIEDPMVLLTRNFSGHPLAGLGGEDQLRKFYWDLDEKGNLTANV